MKLYFPRFFEGREFIQWVRSVTVNIGSDPPATLDELGQESVVPILAKLHSLESTVASLEKKVQNGRSENAELKRRITDIERSI